MRKILDGVWTWAQFSEEKQLDFNGTYCWFADDVFLIDPPPLSEAAVDFLEGHPAPTRILITNKDHRRAAPELRDQFGCQVLVHEADRDLMDTPVDGTFTDGETLVGGFRAIHIPHMKSPGECALHHADRRLLVLGDALISREPGTLELLPPAKVPDPVAAHGSLGRLGDLDFEALLLGDGRPILTGGKIALETYLRQDPVNSVTLNPGPA